MLPTRQETVDNNKRDSTASLSSTSEICQKLQCALLAEPNILKSYVMVDPVIYQPATVKKSSIIFLSPEESESQKQSEGIKSSSHEVKVVSFPDGPCDFLMSRPPWSQRDKNVLPGNGKYVYLLTPDKQLFYLDKYENMATPIFLSEDQLKQLCLAINIEPADNKTTLLENLNEENIRMIAHITKHIHCKAYYKENKPGSVMSAVEAANSLIYEFKAVRLFSTCYAVRDDNDQDIGVLSIHLNGFKPMADNPLEKENLTITSLNLMTKKRDDAEKERVMKIFVRIQKKIISSLDRNPDPNVGYLWQFARHLKNKMQSWVGSEFNAQNIKTSLNSYITSGKQGIDLLSLGSLSSLRKLLINRKNQILSRPDDFNHKHELGNLQKCIEELSIIILDETVFYMKAMREIDKKARNDWIDVETEIKRHNPATTYAVINKEDHLIADVAVSYEDLLNFRIHYGQAVAYTARYFAADPDGHKRNHSKLGPSLDPDQAFCFLVFDLLDEIPYSWRKEDNDFNFYPEDFLEFPDLTRANFRYWPTKTKFVYRTIDTVSKAAGSEASKNFYNDADVEIFKDFAHCPVFCFQKYIQLAIEVLMHEKIYAACAELHMSEQLRMRDSNGNKLSLINDKDHYELHYMLDPLRLPGHIYIEFVNEGLRYETIGFDATLKSYVIPREALPPLFPTNVSDIIEQPEQKEKYLQILLRETSRQGHTAAGWAGDVRACWINFGTQRSQSARSALALKLMPFKMLLERHADFFWECIQEHFESFLEKKRAKCVNPDVVKILEEAVNLDELKVRFNQLRKEVLAAHAEIKFDEQPGNKEIAITPSLNQYV